MKIAMLLRSGVIAAVVVLSAVSCQKSSVQAAHEETNTPGRSANNSLSMDDQTFLIHAERAEIRQQTLARKAQEKSRNPDVYEYARAIAGDRTEVLRELMDLMHKKGLTPPFSVPEVQLEVADRLDSESGNAFDHEFVSLIAAEQQPVVSNFKLAAETAEDPDIRRYATRVLPSLEADLQKAADLEKKLAEPNSSDRPH
jgi:putative membrane protein